MILSSGQPIFTNIIATNFTVSSNFSMLKLDMDSFTLANSTFKNMTITGTSTAGGGRLVSS